MKINIACPETGCTKQILVTDEVKLRIFMEQKLADEIDLSPLGEEYQGYIVKLTGGCDKDGFPMMQGVLTNRRVRLLLDGRNGCFIPLRKGDRRKKSIRGCIVAGDISVLNCIIVQKGKKDIASLTETVTPRKLGPKRANNIRKLFNLEKDEDPRLFVISRKVNKKDGSYRGTKRPKVQRLVTPERVARKKRMMKQKKERWIKAKQASVEYAQLCRKVRNEKKERLEKEKKKKAQVALKQKLEEQRKIKERAAEAKREMLKKQKVARLKLERKKVKEMMKKIEAQKKKAAKQSKAQLKKAEQKPVKKSQQPIKEKPVKKVETKKSQAKKSAKQ